MTDGRLNRLLGWLLLTTTFVVTAALDPWALSHRDPAALAAGLAMPARHAQAVVLGMAFLQLLIGILLAHLEPGSANGRLAALLCAAGALLYSAGYVLFVLDRSGAWVAAAGAALNAAAFALLIPGRFLPALGAGPKAAVVVLCGGLLLDAVMALGAARPELFRPEWVGPDDGVGLRMLRLARAAMVALPLLALHYAEARAAARPANRLLAWAGPVLVFGAAAMPLLLVLSACVWMGFKYLLGLPANATVLGTLAGAWLAYRRQSWLTLAGWLFVLASINAGLLMGLYAFDGPLPDPEFLGAYNDFPRRLSRLGHAYVIIVGLALLNLRRDLPYDSPGIGGWVVAAGGVLMAASAALLAAGVTDHRSMGAGPGLVAFGLFLQMPGIFDRCRGDVRATRGA